MIVEESSSNTTLREIERLKQKISGYRGALLTLKMGDSFDDYLIIKRELDSLKMQISTIEDFTKTFDLKHYAQSEQYEEQVKHFALQLSALNQTVKVMSEEIFNISDKIKPSKREEPLGNDLKAHKKEVQEKKSDSKLKTKEDKTSPNNQTANAPYQPSYMQLRKFPEQKLELQKKEEEHVPVEHNEIIVNSIDQRFFNQSYFQSNLAQPNSAYTGLNKNKSGEATLQFKHFGENQHHLNHQQSFSNTNEPELPNEVPSIYEENLFEIVANEPTSESNNDAFELEQQNQPQSESEIPPEEISNSQESSYVESKKQKNSLFFNLFRK